MKKLLCVLAIILITGIAFGQTFQEGNLVGFHVGILNLDPNVTFNQWMKYALETYSPAFNKEFEGEITVYFATGERGKYKNYVGIYIVFKSIEIRNKYIPEEGTPTELFKTKRAKVQPLYDELTKLGSISEDHYTDWVIQ